MSISTSAPSTCMSAACARRSTAAVRLIRSAPCAAPAMRSTSVLARTSGSRPPDGLTGTIPDQIVPRSERSTADRTLVAAAVGGRLIGDARAIGAVPQAFDRVAAAEEDLRRAWIADRPMTLRIAQLEQRAALTDRDDVLDQFGLGLRLELVESVRGQRGIAAQRRTRHAHHVRRCTRLAR